MTPRLLTKYTEEVRPHLNEQFQYKNVMASSTRNTWTLPSTS